MKIQGIVNVLLGSVLFIMAMNSWADYEPTTSYYGHGEYTCYYLNVHSKKFYKGVSSRKEKAMQLAKEACKPSAKEDYQTECEFADCRCAVNHYCAGETEYSHEYGSGAHRRIHNLARIFFCPRSDHS